MKDLNFYEALEQVTAKKDDREALALLACNNPKILDILVNVAFTPENELSVKASWVLDKLIDKNPEALFPYLDLFLQSVCRVRNESAIRPLARICEIMLREYYGVPENLRIKLIWREQREALVNIAFDWLIGPHKVAVKAYSMTSLYLLGTEFNWIHKELELVLQRNYPQELPAYRARARMVLSKIKKHWLLK